MDSKARRSRAAGPRRADAEATAGRVRAGRGADQPPISRCSVSRAPPSITCEFPAASRREDLLALARQGLRTRLRALVSQVIQTGEMVTDAVPRVQRDGRYFPCRVTVRPFSDPKKQSDLLLVTFEDGPDPCRRSRSAAENIEESSLIGQLENELRATREDLQGTIEEMESSNEEMKASNEEMMSMNEELQSVNEELETSKEELQSTNEELITVNSAT